QVIHQVDPGPRRETLAHEAAIAHSRVIAVTDEVGLRRAAYENCLNPEPQSKCAGQSPGPFISTGQGVSRRHRLGQLLDHRLEVRWAPKNPLHVRESARDPPGRVRHFAVGYASGDDVWDAWRSDNHDPHQSKIPPRLNALICRGQRVIRPRMTRMWVRSVTLRGAGR